MKKRTKKLAGIMLSTVLLLGNVVSVSAGVPATGAIDGTDISGRVSYNATSATAVTSFPRSGGTISVSAIAYALDGIELHADTASATSSAGGVSATATKTKVTTDVCGAKGVHSVKWGSYTWSGISTDGRTN